MPHAVIKRDDPEAAKVLGKWDLGTQRSLDQLINFTGMDTRNYETLHTTCGKLHWVPFKEAPDHDWMDDKDKEKLLQKAMPMLAKDGKEPPPDLTIRKTKPPEG